MTIGNILNGHVKDWVTTESVNSLGETIKVIDWRTLWLVPAGIAAAVGAAFFLLFQERPVATEARVQDEAAVA